MHHLIDGKVVYCCARGECNKETVYPLDGMKTCHRVKQWNLYPEHEQVNWGNAMAKGRSQNPMKEGLLHVAQSIRQDPCVRLVVKQGERETSGMANCACIMQHGFSSLCGPHGPNSIGLNS